MKQINIQFRARKSEIIKYLLDIVIKKQLTMVGVKLFPEFVAETINATDIIDTINQYRVIVISKSFLNDVNGTYNDYMEKQQGNLIITLGADNERELIESSMGVISDGEIDTSWKKIIADFKKQLLKGAWVINPNNKAKSYLKDHRYSLEAKEAYVRGVKICASAGVCIYELKDN